MNRHISSLCLLVSAAVLFVSCLNSDEEKVTLYDDVAITEFQITSAKVYKHTTSSKGEDSVYVDTDETVQYYPFYIDQLKGEIYNVDSLPAGTDAKTLLCGYSTKNNGFVVIENETRDSLKSLMTTDSTDFTKPRYLRVYSSDGQTFRSYKVTVNIHNERANEFRWNRLADNAELAALTGMRAVTLGGRILVLGGGNGSTAVYSTAETDGGSWTRTAAALGEDAYNNVVSRNDTLFVLDGGVIKASTDGASFTDVAVCPEIARLAGGSTTELYALGTDGGLMVSADGGRSWTAETLDAGAAFLPAQDMAYSCSVFSGTDSADYVILAGSRGTDSYPDDRQDVVWRKIVEYSAGSPKGKWAYMESDEYVYYPLPRLSGLNLLSYNGSVIAFGGAGIGACDKPAFSQIYESRDGGITWKRNGSYAFPSGFDTSAPSVASAVDSQGNIWLVCAGSGQVWRGRLNSVGWEK